MRSLAVIILDPGGDLDPRMGKAEEQRLVEQLVAQAAVEALDEAVLQFCIGLPGAMKCQSTLLSRHQVSMALQVYSVP